MSRHVLLSRAQTVKPLLRQMHGRKTNINVLQEQPDDENDEDIERSPASTEDEQEESLLGRLTPPKGARTHTSSVGFKAHDTSPEEEKGKTSRSRTHGSRRPPVRTLRSVFKDEGGEINNNIHAHLNYKGEAAGHSNRADEYEQTLDEWCQSNSQKRQRLSQTTYKSKSRGFQTPAEKIHDDTTPKRRSFQDPPQLQSESLEKSGDASRSFRNPQDKLITLDTKNGRNKNNRTFQPPRSRVKKEFNNSRFPDISAAHSATNISTPSTQSQDGDAFSETSDLSSCPPDAEMEEEALAFASTQDGGDKTLAHCPICREMIDSEFLNLFTNGKRLHWRDKLALCDSHKRRDAEKTWNERGYPAIQWDGFHERLKEYHGRLRDLLDGKKRSGFREQLSDKVESGRVRQVFRDVRESKKETTTPGYYGSKGATLMHSHIISTFGSRLRDVAEEDVVMRSAGVSNYVRSVLVPELAMMLIKDDMGIAHDADERAKVIMNESAEMGDLTNPQDEDNIKQEADDDLGIYTQAG